MVRLLAVVTLSYIKPEKVKGSLRFSDEFWAYEGEYFSGKLQGPGATSMHVLERGNECWNDLGK